MLAWLTITGMFNVTFPMMLFCVSFRRKRMCSACHMTGFQWPMTFQKKLRTSCVSAQMSCSDPQTIHKETWLVYNLKKANFLDLQSFKTWNDVHNNSSKSNASFLLVLVCGSVHDVGIGAVDPVCFRKFCIYQIYESNVSDYKRIIPSLCR